MDLRRRTDFRVIAEGDDAVGSELTLPQALAALDLARQQGRRFVSIVDDTTGAIVDERQARTWVKRGPPPLPADLFAPCPACEDEGGVSTGDVLVQLPSGTWLREPCTVCHGSKRVQRATLAQREAQMVDEPAVVAPSTGRRIASGTRPRVARVLVVGSEPPFAEALRRSLSDELEVRIAVDARRALASMMAGDAYDLVLCQLRMPGMNGDELRDRVRATLPALAARFVFIGDPRGDVRAVCALVRRLTATGGAGVDEAAAHGEAGRESR